MTNPMNPRGSPAAPPPSRFDATTIAPPPPRAPSSSSSMTPLEMLADALDPMPEAGDSVGPYYLKRELGRGGFARVFLAEQTDLEDRLVVLKFSWRATREPWLLARARHPNIVPILSRAEVNDGALQMLAMPFLGGATLSAILGRRGRGESPRPSSRRLLDDLDAAAAAELPAAGWESPSRRLLATMTDERAFAWIAARVAEALDHAHGRGVAHGDVKPSNILLTAAGEPMLLDFNLARAADADPRVMDCCGTPAYMAPERLAILVDGGGPRSDVDPHRADLYALGLTLLEALTGWSASLDGGGCDGPPAARVVRLVEARAAGGERLVRRVERSTGRSISPALRSILAHCLQTDPDARYDQGWRLADDLDRFRGDRPLAFAPEPAWRHVLARWVRRNRRGLVAGAGAGIAAGLVAAALIAGDWRLDRKLEGEAMGRLALLQDDPQTSIFDFQRTGEPLRRRDPADAAALALRSLRAYHLLADASWRDRDAFRHLPAADREDLELHLLEQALRYGRILADRPASPVDWRRAAMILDRAFQPGAWPRAAIALRRRLASQLGEAEPPSLAGSGAAPWIEAYLDGVVAELDAQAPGAANPAGDGDGLDAALDRYGLLLRLRPDSFWGHYRSAVIAFGRRRWEAAAADLAVCLARRPDNPILQGFLATCLLNQGRFDEAMARCDQALEAAPDRAEFFQTRAFIRAAAIRPEGLEADIQRYELLRRLLPPSYFQNPMAGDLADPTVGSVAASRRGLPLADMGAWRPRDGGSPTDLVAADAGELDSRALLAARIRDAGLPDLAAGELTKLLTLEPAHLVGRVDRLCLLLDRGSRTNPQWLRQARDDLDEALEHPGLRAFAASSPDRLDALRWASREFSMHGQHREALRLAQAAVEASRAAKISLGRSYYTLAQVQAAAARTEDKWADDAAENLRRAIAANRDFETWFIQDPVFNPIRPRVRTLLGAR